VLSETERYDLRGGSVTEGWQQFLRKVRGRRASRTTKCTTCQLRALCGMCPAVGQLENGDPEEPVDFLCQVAHLRALALGPQGAAGSVRIPPHGDCQYGAGGEGHEALVAAADRLRRGLATGPASPAAGRRSLALVTGPASGCGARSCAEVGDQ
jgi:hypothetical protein